MKRQTKVKVCGMTRSTDVQAAVALGVDAIGIILHADSPRLINQTVARSIRSHVPSDVLLVGVFVNADLGFIHHCIQSIGLDLVQLHGEESDDFGVSLDVPYIKALRVNQTEKLARELTAYPNASAILLDAYIEGQHGGTGITLDHKLWPTTKTSQKLILAGGLTPDNVKKAITELAPYAVDLNSGVENAPGIKDVNLMTSAIHAIGR